MSTLLAALATAAALASGWILYSVERVRRFRAESTTREVRRNLSLAEERSDQHQELLDVARAEIKALLEDADACSDPDLVRRQLDELSKDMQADDDPPPMPKPPPFSDSIITGDLE